MRRVLPRFALHIAVTKSKPAGTIANIKCSDLTPSDPHVLVRFDHLADRIIVNCVVLDRDGNEPLAGLTTARP